MTDSGESGRSRADEFERLAETDPSALREHVDELGTHLVDERAAVRSGALRAAVALSAVAPADAVPLVDGLADRLGDGALRADAALALGNVAADDASAVLAVLPALVAVLDDGGEVRANATYAMAAVAGSEPDALAGKGVRRRLFGLLDDERPAVRVNVTRCLDDVAAADPAAVCDGAEQLGDRLDDDHPAVRATAAHALGTIAPACPDRVVAVVPDLVGLRDDPDPAVRAAAAFALGYPTRLPAADATQAVASLLALASHEDPAVRQHVTAALATLAGTSPDAVEPGVEAIAVGLADEHRPVRRNAAAALAALRGSVPDAVDAARADLVERLESVGDGSEPAPFSLPGLRALAADAAAPDELRAAARRAVGLVEAGEATLAPDTDGDSEVVGEVADGFVTDPPVGDAGAVAGGSDQSAEETPAFCPDCGASLDSDGVVCPACGTNVE